MPAPKAATPPTKGAIGNNVAALLNATGTALPEQSSSFNPIQSWSVDEFRAIPGAKLETPFMSKLGNVVSLITRPDGSTVYCGISNSVKKLLSEQGFVKSKILVSIMPATGEYAQGFLMHLAQGSGAGKDYYPEVD
jgi:hypothetical protein